MPPPCHPALSGLAETTTELEVAAVAASPARVTHQPAWPCRCLRAAREPGSDPAQVTALLLQGQRGLWL